MLSLTCKVSPRACLSRRVSGWSTEFTGLRPKVGVVECSDEVQDGQGGFGTFLVLDGSDIANCGMIVDGSFFGEVALQSDLRDCVFLLVFGSFFLHCGLVEKRSRSRVRNP